MARKNIYVIPDNFIEGGKLFNGLFKIRNLIEAILLGGLVAIPLLAIPYPSWQVKITVMISCIAPVMMIGVAGINDDSLIEFIKSLLKWKQNKRIIMYNGNVRPREVRSSDVIEAQELPKDKLITAMDNWKEKRKESQANVTYVEGIDFEFDEDSDITSSYKSAEKKLIDEKNGNVSKTNTKKAKKKKKKSEPLFIQEKSTYDDDFIEINNSTEFEAADVIGEDDIDVH